MHSAMKMGHEKGGRHKELKEAGAVETEITEVNLEEWSPMPGRARNNWLDLRRVYSPLNVRGGTKEEHVRTCGVAVSIPFDYQ